MSEDSSTHTGAHDLKPEPLGVIEIITRVKQGLTDPKSLDPGDRRQCAAYLFGEGMSTPEIARLLKVTERTIRRDREQIREEQSIARDPRLAGRIARPSTRSSASGAWPASVKRPTPCGCRAKPSASGSCAS